MCVDLALLSRLTAGHEQELARAVERATRVAMPAGRRLADLGKSAGFRVDCIARKETSPNGYASMVAQLVRRDQKLPARARLEPRGGVLLRHCAGGGELPGRLVQEEVRYANTSVGSTNPPKHSLFGEPAVAAYVRVSETRSNSEGRR